MPAPQSSIVRRFTWVSLAAIGIAGVVYLWVLWDLWLGTISPLRTTTALHSVYDVQARALLNGRLTLPNGSIGPEAFLHHGTYTYFGVFPSVLRMPVLMVTHSLDGRLTVLSMSAAWVVTAVFATLLLWRIRVVLRGHAPLGRVEAASHGVLLFSILAGSVLLFLGSQANAYTEDLTWSIALACASFFALAGVAERPSWSRVLVCGLFVLLTNLNRATTGYACIAGTLLLASWFGLGRGGVDRRLWAIPVLLAGLVPMAAGCAIDFAKFGLLFGIPSSDQVLYKYFGYQHLNSGHYWGLRYLPSTLQAYVDPRNIRFASLFPYIMLPDIPAQPIAHTALFNRAPTASLLPSMPLLMVSGVWGAVTSFLPQRVPAARALRIILVAAALPAAGIMVFGWILERFVGDAMPLVILASMIGIVDVSRRLGGRSHRWRPLVPVVIGMLAALEFVANVGFAITPDQDWTQAQANRYVSVQRALSDLTGHPLASDVLQGSGFPFQARAGQVLIQGDCKALFVAYQATLSSFALPNMNWIPVERAPNTPICRSLQPTATGIPLATRIITPSQNATLSGARTSLAAIVSASGRNPSVSFVLSGRSLRRPITLATGNAGLGGWSYIWDTRSVPDGTYRLTSVATDETDHRAASPGVTVTIRNTNGAGLPIGTEKITAP